MGWWRVSCCFPQTFKVDGGCCGSLQLSLLFLFMGNLLLYSRLEVVLVFPLGWGSSEIGGIVNVLFWASLFSFFFLWVASFVHFKLTSVDGKGGFGLIQKYGTSVGGIISGFGGKGLLRECVCNIASFGG